MSEVKKFVPSAALLALAAIISTGAWAHAARASDSTYNWAGYLATSARYSSVSGSWVVPKMASSSAETANGQWVGIGGYTSADLIQTGTRAISEDGATRYEAWYELIPAPAVVVPLAITPGDSVSAFIFEISPGEWSIILSNLSTGETYETQVSYASSHSSAEWVEEMPKGPDSYVPLGNFSPITFYNARTVANGTIVSARAAGARALSLVTEAGESLASPTPLLAADTFRVAR